MQNLIVIGWTGVKTCYLGLSKQQAIYRFAEKNGGLTAGMTISVYSIEDEFDAYDAFGDERLTEFVVKNDIALKDIEDTIRNRVFEQFMELGKAENLANLFPTPQSPNTEPS